MASSQRHCSLHLDGNHHEEIKSFDGQSWNRAQLCDTTRHNMYKTSRYFRINLPAAYNDRMGYHTQCYKDFTAIQTTRADAPSSSSSKPVLRSCAPDCSKTTSTGIFPKKCLFCMNVSKSLGKGQREALGSCLTDKAEDNIKEAAGLLQDDVMLARLSGIDLKSKEVKYHHSCRKDYLNKASAVKRDQDPKELSSRTLNHKAAFDVLKLHIEPNLIENEGAESLASLHKRYMTSFDVSTYSAQSLCDKILKEYPQHLKKLPRYAGVIIYNSALSEDAAVRRASFDEMSVKEAALYLRSLILDMRRQQEELPQPITAESVVSGQGTTPAELLQFFRVLYTGSTSPATSDKIERLVQSVCDDVVYATTRGRTKPSKHLSMGLGLKSLTGSRRILEIINRYGHCVSYHAVESLETDLATNISQRNYATPDGICQIAGLGTGTAWDNYDERNESLSGSGTLHDTVGICYQNIVEVNTQPPEADNVPRDTVGGKKSKRMFQLKESVLEPYRKKPKITVFQYQVKDIPRPLHITNIEHQDLIWMMCTYLGETPMWAGWNSLVTEDPLPTQRISYMDNLNLPPTRLDVIAETLRISQRVANECGDQYAVVHYDLAVAKPAMQIQEAESPLFDNVFICFGPFHIEMAFFGALGHILDGSGGPHILTETEVLAPGSLNGFLAGKHYNRCRRLHPLLSTAFQILHFRQFLEVTGPLPDALESLLHSARSNPTEESLTEMEDREDYRELMAAYIEYTDKTLKGEHGSTAKFWLTYIRLVNIFLKFSRAYRTNDVYLFVFSLSQMCPIFVAGNRPNYSRWMVRYVLNLVNMDITHPGVRDVLQNGALSIRRTNKAFSRSQVDITLEQTVNADAASRSTGIASFSLSASARRRWMITRSVRSAIVGNLLLSCGMKKTEDISRSLKPYRIRKDNDDLQKLVAGIESTMNPFVHEPDESLYCITTGVKVADEIKEDLLECFEKGQQWHDDFLTGCFQDASRFERPIPRRKVRNFASAAVKTKIGIKEQKVVELQGTRDLFGRLLFLSTVEKIDMEKVFKYPLTPVPLSLAHLDGSLNKTDKSKLLHKLEGMVESDVPDEIDVTIVDAMFLLHTLHSPPQSYGKIADDLLRKLCGMSKRVEFVCDTYMDPSI